MTLVLALLLAVKIAPPADGPAKQPQIVATQTGVALTYGSGNKIYFARSEDGARTFTPPVLVAEEGSLSLGMHRGPRITTSGNTTIISAVVGRKGGGADGDLLAWRSTDNGKTWSKGTPINDAPGAAREGLHSMTSNGRDLVFATWLDLRDKGTRLYSAVSRDGGKSWSKNVLVQASPSGSICQCCHPSAAIGPDGRITVMFRNESAGARDMYIVASSDGGNSFGPAQKLGTGTWLLNACPMDGGGITLDPKGNLETVWRREKTIYAAIPGQPETALGTGKDATTLHGKSGLYYAWTTPGGLSAKLPGRPDPVLLDPHGAYAQLVQLPDGSVIAAWETEGSIAVQKVQ
ncbi:MAG: BNR/Asp-box repeat protein [Bryobacterales bacterium]|nr:BNR/Asp-box repeat protein [Bryobacterales bacterium]